MRRLLVGNLTAAIVMGMPGCKPHGLTAAQRDKCAAQSARLLWLCEKDDAVLLARAPEESFLSYVEGVLGFRPTVYAPQEMFLNDARSVAEAALADIKLLNALTHIGAFGDSWNIAPFVQDPAVYKLAIEIGLRVQGMNKTIINNGLATQLNDKAWFQKRCHELDIPVPSSVLHRRGELEDFPVIAYAMYQRSGTIVVRHTTAAGGSGNVKIASGYTSAEAFREALEPALHLLRGGDVLIEPFYIFEATPTVLMRIVGGTPHLVAIVMREVNDRLASTGGVMPARLHPGVTLLLEQWSLRYADAIASTVVDGDVDIDWGIYHDESGDLRLLALESNCRMTGTGPIVAVRDRLYAEGPVFSWNCDSMPVEYASFVVAHADFRAQDLLWQDGEGVVIMTPPHAGRMGVAVFARSAEQRDAFRRGVNDLR